jgi:hypothetical protein
MVPHNYLTTSQRTNQDYNHYDLVLFDEYKIDITGATVGATEELTTS